MDGNNENPARRRRRKRSPLATPSSSSTPAADYKEEHVHIVRHIMSKKNNYYQILGIQSTCTNNQVRTAYKKVSLKVHPDKNHAPGAEKAFLLVNKAYQCLSDPEKRKKYDLLGREDEIQEEDVEEDGDQILNLGFEFLASILWRYSFFFGFPFPRAGGVNQNSWRRSLIRLLLLILVFFVLKFLFPSEPMQQVDTGYSLLMENCRREWEDMHYGYGHSAPHCELLEKFGANVP